MEPGRTIFLICEANSISQSLAESLSTIYSDHAFQVKSLRFDDCFQDSFDVESQTINDPVWLIIGDISLSHERKSEAWLIEKIRINRRWKESIRKAPILLLTYQETPELIRREPRNVLLLSEGCRVIRAPFLLDELLASTSQVTPVNDLARLKKLFLLDSRLAQIEQRDKHDLANLFGPLRLLRGACLAGEIPQNEYENLTGEMENKLARDAYYNEYLDLQGTFGPGSATGQISFQPGSRQLEMTIRKVKLHILLIDDQHSNGWGRVFQEILLPRAKEKIEGEIVRFMNHPKDSVSLDCLSRIDSPDGSDDFGTVKAILEYSNPDKLMIEKYDMILLDLRLRREKPDVPVEGLSGYQLLHNIRKFDPIIPVIAFTASEKAYNLLELYKLGISGYFAKQIPSTDEAAKQSFITLKQMIESVIAKIHLRSIWYNIKLAESAIDSSPLLYPLRKKALSDLLKAAFEKIYYASSSRIGFHSPYNEAVILYHQALEEYLENGLREHTYSKIGKKIKSEPAKLAGRELNTLRNEVLHERPACSEGEALVASLWICYLLIKEVGPQKLGKLKDSALRFWESIKEDRTLRRDIYKFFNILRFDKELHPGLLEKAIMLELSEQDSPVTVKAKWSNDQWTFEIAPYNSTLPDSNKLNQQVKKIKSDSGINFQIGIKDP